MWRDLSTGKSLMINIVVKARLEYNGEKIEQVVIKSYKDLYKSKNKGKYKKEGRGRRETGMRRCQQF